MRQKRQRARLSTALHTGESLLKHPKHFLSATLVIRSERRYIFMEYLLYAYE